MTATVIVSCDGTVNDDDALALAALHDATRPLEQGGQESTGPRAHGQRERWLIGCSAALLAMLAVAVVIALASAPRSSRDGCIAVSAVTGIGGSELYRCGGAARSLCGQATVSRGSSNVAFQRALVVACREAGLPVAAAPGR